MCQTSVIYDDVTRLSRRSFRHRMESASAGGYHVGQLSRLNAELTRLYDFLYDQYPTITEDDYKVFGPQLLLLLETLKGLRKSCETLPEEFRGETERLASNYSSLREINSDIVNFRIKLPSDEHFRSLMSEASRLLQA